MEQAVPIDENSPDVQPIVVVSQCLGFAAVRYNGAMLQDDFVQALGRHVQFVQVCPEVGIGLGVPRDPIRLIVENDERRLVQPSTHRDLTALMHRFSTQFLDDLRHADGFILKSRSPSCAIKDSKTYFASGPMPAPGKGPGLFAEHVLRRFPHAAIEDEGRLTSFRLRHHFLAKLFANARLRQAGAKGSRAALVAFHTEHKLQFMSYSHTGMTALGRIVATPEKTHPAKIFEEYASAMAHVMAQPPRPSATRNALLHAFGYVSEGLNGSEKKYFLRQVDDYRAERLPLSALLSLLRAWALRFDQHYLLGQRLFMPYPAAVLTLVDSGAKG
jgi:uncharacterized protein YbgA (DUF1722 family)/uncharacterized protein YbbK (DUF523 family)